MERVGAEDPWQLRRALDGDRAAWTALVAEFHGTIWQWARRVGLEREDAEDVCQSVWYLLKDRGHTIEDPRRLPGWLATTTRHEAFAVTRKRTRRTHAEAPLSSFGEQQLASADPAAYDLLVMEETHSGLVDSFRQLSPKCRELLPLLWAKLLSYSEIGQLLEMPVGSIGPNKKRCLDALRAGMNL